MISKPAASDGARDFDFLHGRWHIVNRRLKHRLQGCEDWEEFPANTEARPLPGGIGNYDDYLAPQWRPGFVGMSLRIYNPVSQLWSIYWLENQSGGLDSAGHLRPPVVGRFQDGIGIFEGDDAMDGRPIKVRYTWVINGERQARWQQAMSGDGGLHWETNWIMDFTRMGA